MARQDFTGISDWYADTASLTLDPAFKNYFLQDPKNIDQRRFNAYRYFLEFYRGRHWEESGEVNPAFGNKSLLDEEYNRRTWNLVRNIIKKLVSFLMKESWTTKLPAALEDIEDADDDGNEIHKKIEAVWEANDRDTFNYSLAYMGSIMGDAFVRISWDNDFYAEDVGELRFDVLDSRTVLPFFDSNDRTKMIGCRIQYPIFEIQPDGSKKQVTHTEVHTENNIVTFLDGEVTQILPNPLGELLVVHFKNEPLPTDRFGTSDLYDLILASKEYNEKLSDLSEILSYHAAPLTIIKGARVQNLERGAKKVWGGIPAEGDVFNLDLPAGGAEAAQNYIQLLKQHIHETGNVPEEALGALQNVSNTSGAALQIQYQPLLERIQEKQKCYAKGLKKMNEIILKFYDAAGVIELPEDIGPDQKYRTIINWGSPLPRDSSLMLADEATKIGLGIQSKKGALKDMGEENPDAKLQEVEDEQLRQAQLDFVTAGLGGFGDPGAGPDGMGGQPGAAPGGPGAGRPGSKPGAMNGPKPNVSGAINASKTNPNVHGANVSQNAVKQSAQTTTAQNKKPF